MGEWRCKPVGDKMLWFCHYPHRINGEDKTGIAVMLDGPIENQLLRAMHEAVEYAIQAQLIPDHSTTAR